MSHSSEVTAMFPSMTIGLDLGDRQSQIYVVDATGARIEERTLATSPETFARYFENRRGARVVLEVGTHSPWVSRQLADAGLAVFVANPSAMYGARRRSKHNDRLDAEYLARQGRADVRLLHAIRHRGAKTQAHLARLRARDQLVKSRTLLTRRRITRPRRPTPGLWDSINRASTKPGAIQTARARDDHGRVGVCHSRGQYRVYDARPTGAGTAARLQGAHAQPCGLLTSFLLPGARLGYPIT